MSKLVLVTVTHAFDGRTVLRDVSLVTQPGEMVALVGPSGSGKSTLAAIAAGILRPQSGRVMRLYQRHGMVFQQSRLLPWETARGNIAFPLLMDGMNKAEATARAEEAALAVALLPSDLDKMPDQLSGGMRARVAIARALAVAPDFLIFDEPFAALDPALRRRMQDLVIDLSARFGFGGLFITHDLSEAARVADRIAVLDRKGDGIIGALTPEGTPGARREADIFAFVQREMTGNPLLADLVNVDERALDYDCACDTLGPRRCC
ncbi:ABC transporter ATP-binding protein [Roseibacterium beibuensis]|uniref:ATP-binding cassette domain-containing protein n=1 Tax=[Roseibacterium] beibuensis TaxID=1193142 RepID=A0ABP9LQ38_9RHOB|nr:ABC transporter ATP-binding protein [Roseibacterium beibuensis]MCS6626877.1 ABC transporter ATP-binding protein [Roseibacterium beibuensis]